MSRTPSTDRLVTLRRDLHRHPEPAWREFYTTARIVEEVERIGVDALYVGRDALATEYRAAVPDEAELDRWYDRALAAGAREDVLETLAGGYTGAVAVVERGEGPTVALRVDVDGLEREESTDPDHAPVAEGFRSEIPGMMHACGHDAHVTIGLGVLEAITESDFTGTFKLLFQPGEELGAGGEPMARSGHLDDVDHLLVTHVGLGYPTGTVVPDVSEFLAVGDFRAEFTGEAAHAGGNPQAGRNAILALATAVQNLHAIPRHEDGMTRINVGEVAGGSATNVVPERAVLEGEARGETTELWEYMRAHVDRILRTAAELHDCAVDVEYGTVLPTARSDAALVDVVATVARETPGVTDIGTYDSPGGSEDATILMREVQSHGGQAAYVGIGTDHPTDHHTATFDVDERSIPIGVDVLAGAVRALGGRRPSA